MNFDRVADIYDTTRAMPEAVLEEVVDCIVAATNPTSHTRFLEIGVGTGRIALPIARRGFDYTGIDISERMMGVLRRKADAEGIRIELVHGDITRLPFPDDSFDVVVAVHILHLVPEWRTALDEVARVLTANGVLAIGGEHPGGSDLYHEMRARWGAFVREAGAETRPQFGTWERIEEDLTDRGCYVAMYRAAHWEADFVPVELLEAQRARTFSQSWDVPDDVLERAHEQMVRWGTERIGDLRTQQRVSEDFWVMVTRFTPPTA